MICLKKIFLIESCLFLFIYFIFKGVTPENSHIVFCLRQRRIISMSDAGRLVFLYAWERYPHYQSVLFRDGL